MAKFFKALKQKLNKVVPDIFNKKSSNPTNDDFLEVEGRGIPVLLATCVKFIEAQGLDTEGIYRVSGELSDSDQIYNKCQEDAHFDLSEMNIPVTSVAAALKLFVKNSPALLTKKQIKKLIKIFLLPDQATRLVAMRTFLTKKMTPANFRILKFIIEHLAKVAGNRTVNKMDSKNLAIYWFSSLLPMNFSNINRYQKVRPHQQGLVQTMIDQFAFLFLGENEIVAPNGNEFVTEPAANQEKKRSLLNHMFCYSESEYKELIMKKGKTVDVEINNQEATMLVDRKTFDSAISTELWQKLGKPELQPLDDHYFQVRKPTGKLACLLKKPDFKGFFMGNVKIKNDEHSFPILVFDKPDTPNIIGQRVFCVLYLNSTNSYLINKPSKK